MNKDYYNFQLNTPILTPFLIILTAALGVYSHFLWIAVILEVSIFIFLIYTQNKQNKYINKKINETNDADKYVLSLIESKIPFIIQKENLKKINKSFLYNNLVNEKNETFFKTNVLVNYLLSGIVAIICLFSLMQISFNLSFGIEKHKFIYFSQSVFILYFTLYIPYYLSIMRTKNSLYRFLTEENNKKYQPHNNSKTIKIILYTLIFVIISAQSFYKNNNYIIEQSRVLETIQEEENILDRMIIGNISNNKLLYNSKTITGTIDKPIYFLERKPNQIITSLSFVYKKSHYKNITTIEYFNLNTKNDNKFFKLFYQFNHSTNLGTILYTGNTD